MSVGVGALVSFCDLGVVSGGWVCWWERDGLLMVVVTRRLVLPEPPSDRRPEAPSPLSLVQICKCAWESRTCPWWGGGVVG